MTDIVERLRYRVSNPSAWDDYDEGASEIMREAADEMTRLRAAIAWTREVRPGKNPESGGAIVHMTWDQFNTMRVLARAALEPKP